MTQRNKTGVREGDGKKGNSPWSWKTRIVEKGPRKAPTRESESESRSRERRSVVREMEKSEKERQNNELLRAVEFISPPDEGKLYATKVGRDSYTARGVDEDPRCKKNPNSRGSVGEELAKEFYPDEGQPVKTNWSPSLIWKVNKSPADRGTIARDSGKPVLREDQDLPRQDPLPEGISRAFTPGRPLEGPENPQNETSEAASPRFEELLRAKKTWWGAYALKGGLTPTS